MNITDPRIDGGRAFDWGKTSADYAKFRDIYPEEFYDKILRRRLCIHFRQTHMVVADGPHPKRSIQANQIKSFALEQFPCLTAQIAAGIVAVECGFAVLFANIEQAFFQLVVVSGEPVIHVAVGHKQCVDLPQIQAISERVAVGIRGEINQQAAVQ